MALAAALATILWAQALPPAEAAPPAPLQAAPEAAPHAPMTLPIDLRWDAPAGCPALATVRAAIARSLPAVTGGIAPMQISIAVRALDGEHWQAALDLRGLDWTATRTLKGASCAAVADAAGLVIGLALTSELAAQVVVVGPPPLPLPSTPVVALALAGDAGALPAATLGGALALGWRSARARAELRADLFEARSGTVADHPDTGGRLSLASFAARGCALWGRAASLGPCAVAGVDRLHGVGFGPVTTGEATNLAPFLGLGAQGEWRLSRWVATFLSVEAAIPLVRARFSVENVGLVHEAAAVSFRGAAGLELRFR
jgi:hypothetical protein